MSFTKKRREQIVHYILEKIDLQQKDFVNSVCAAYGISRNTVYRYLRELLENETINKKDGEYYLNETKTAFALSRSKGELSSEDVVYAEKIRKYIEPLPDNVRRIWEYSFMEMMNNAIEHSDAENVEVCIVKTSLNTSITIADDGVGIFNKIQNFYKLPLIDDAINELFKGKLTTDSRRHSGEGIFFTSRVLDTFAAVSDGRIFSHNDYKDVVGDLKYDSAIQAWEDIKGTCIFMKLANDSSKELKEIFDMFSDVDGGFTKTEIPLKNIYGTFPVSRSQAKRLCNRFEKFEKVVLDFSGIEEVGQGFAHEIFAVYAGEHPETEIIPKNANNDVAKMIRHVLRD